MNPDLGDRKLESEFQLCSTCCVTLGSLLPCSGPQLSSLKKELGLDAGVLPLSPHASGPRGSTCELPFLHSEGDDQVEGSQHGLHWLHGHHWLLCGLWQGRGNSLWLGKAWGAWPEP